MCSEIDDAQSLIDHLKRTVFAFIDIIEQTARHDYELLLQEAEAKIRDHIRVILSDHDQTYLN